MKPMRPIPVSEAERIAKRYGYHQVVIVARNLIEGDSVTTYGSTKVNSKIVRGLAAFLRLKVVQWREAQESKS